MTEVQSSPSQSVPRHTESHFYVGANIPFISAVLNQETVLKETLHLKKNNNIIFVLHLSKALPAKPVSGAPWQTAVLWGR